MSQAQCYALDLHPLIYSYNNTMMCGFKTGIVFIIFFRDEEAGNEEL